MCTNIKEITNKYTGQQLYVECGKCEACLQKKADIRANKIRNNSDNDHVCLFYHLTYANIFAPYIKKSDLKVGCSGDVPVYRDASIRWVYSPDIHTTYKKITLGTVQLDTYHYDDLKQSEFNMLYEFQPNKVSVLYYPDIQRFFKRMRINLQRNEKYKGLLSSEEHFKMFVAGEYGETFQRAHNHILQWVPRFRNDINIFNKWRQLVIDCWQYALDFVTAERFEYAINAASYASSYVNCSQDISPFLRKYDFKPYWHYSQDFGLALDSFSISKIFEAIDNGNFEYHVQYLRKDKTLASADVPYPSYVCNRYFPKFKGLYKLSYSDIRGFIQHCISLSEYIGNEVTNICNYKFHFTQIYTYIDGKRMDNRLACFWSWFHRIQRIIDVNNDDMWKILKHFQTCYQRINKDRKLSWSDYAFYYVRVLQLKMKSVFKQQYTFEDFQPYKVFQKYYNLHKLLSSHIPKDWKLFDSFSYWLGIVDVEYIVPVNEYQDIRRKTSILQDRYINHVKTKKINSLTYG